MALQEQPGAQHIVELAAAGSIVFNIHDPAGNNLGGGSMTAAATGWHTIVLTSNSLPPSGAPFAFTIEYTASQTLTQEQF